MVPVGQAAERDEFLALVCADEDLLRAEFEAIVDENWARPPPVPPNRRRRSTGPPIVGWPRTTPNRPPRVSVRRATWGRQRAPPRRLVEPTSDRERMANFSPGGGPVSREPGPSPAPETGRRLEMTVDTAAALTRCRDELVRAQQAIRAEGLDQATLSAAVQQVAQLTETMAGLVELLVSRAQTDDIAADLRAAANQLTTAKILIEPAIADLADTAA